MNNLAQPLLLGVVLVVVVLFMFRNGRKRQRDQTTLTQSMRPGAEVMTTFGVYGTIESIDDAENKGVIRTGPSSELTVHRQAIRQVVTAPTDGTDAAEGSTLNGEPVVLDDAASDPAYGERVAPSDGADQPAEPTETPVRRTGGGGTGAGAE